MKKTIVLSILASFSLCAATVDEINLGLKSFNEKAAKEGMPIVRFSEVGSTDLGNGAEFMILKDEIGGQFANVVYIKGLDFAIVPAQMMPVGEKANVLWETKQTKISNMVNKVMTDSVMPIYKAIPSEMKISFNSKINDNSYNVYFMDPLCPHCVNKLPEIEKEVQAGKYVEIVVLNAFAEESSDACAYLLSGKEYKNFADFQVRFLGSGSAEKSTDEKVVALKNKLMEESRKVFETRIITGTPYVLNVKN